MLEGASLVITETIPDLATLTQSLLAKAFRGELVPQDPTDEPATALLARLREQSEAEASSKIAKKKSGRRSRVK